MNQFGSNYDADAIVDCCCDFSVDQIIDDLEGTHSVKELCSGGSTSFDLDIVRDANTPDGVIISNFNNSGNSIKAVWNNGEFKLQKDWNASNCDVAITGSLHRNNGRIHIIYAAISPSSCSEYSSKTCETRGL